MSRTARTDGKTDGWTTWKQNTPHRGLILTVVRDQMSQSMTKPTKWPLCPAKTQNGLSIRQIWSVFIVHLKKVSVLSCSKYSDQTGQTPRLMRVWMPRLIWRLDAQADLGLCWAQRSFCWFCHAPAQVIYSQPLWPLCHSSCLTSIIWASSWDYGTYHIGDQRRLRRACASAQSRLSLRCSHTWSMEVDEGSDQKSYI